MDFVDDIVRLGEEVGMRIDQDMVYAPTVCVVDRITAYNINKILTSIGFTSTRC